MGDGVCGGVVGDEVEDAVAVASGGSGGACGIVVGEVGVGIDGGVGGAGVGACGVGACGAGNGDGDVDTHGRTPETPASRGKAVNAEEVAEKIVKILSENPASAGADIQKIIDEHPQQLKEALLCLHQVMQAPEMFLPHLCAEDKAVIAYKLGGIHGEMLKCKA